MMKCMWTGEDAMIIACDVKRIGNNLDDRLSKQNQIKNIRFMFGFYYCLYLLLIFLI